VTAPRRVVERRGFGRALGRLPDAHQQILGALIAEVIADPLRGEPKKGALRGVRVVKRTIAQQHYLLAYRFRAATNALELLEVGSHQNFYRDLQRSLQQTRG
jgi:mRNA-degrading endonuclease YafQ of YafQ-DinJ toxin-antitoxin module